MATQQPEAQQELPGLNTPIGWHELADLFSAEEAAHLEVESAKEALKAAKIALTAGGRRVRATQAAEALRIATRGMANRHIPANVDPETGEVTE